LKWIFSEGFPLVQELAQPVWLRSHNGGAPLLTIFHEEGDIATKQILQNIAKENKGKALFSWSTRHQLLEQWGASGRFLPSAVIVTWIGEEPKMIVWNEDNDVAFNETGLNAFIQQALDGTYPSYKKSEVPPKKNDGPVLTLVGKTFVDLVYDSEKSVFVDFYTPWCGHCKKLAPIWEELGATTRGDNVIIAKMDLQANSAPDDLNIKGYPTLILFNKKEQILYEGARDLDAFKMFLKSSLPAVTPPPETAQEPANAEPKKTTQEPPEIAKETVVEPKETDKEDL